MSPDKAAGVFPAADPAGRTSLRVGREYLLAAAASGFAWLLSYPLEPYVDRGDFPLYLGAVMLSAWYGGLGPGLLTTIVGAIVGMNALAGTGADSAPLSSAVVTRLGVFVLEALVICAVSGALRRTEARAQSLAASEQTARRALEAAAHQIRARAARDRYGAHAPASRRPPPGAPGPGAETPWPPTRWSSSCSTTRERSWRCARRMGSRKR